MLPFLIAAGTAIFTESAMAAAGAAVVASAITQNSSKNTEGETTTRRITKDQIPDSVRKSMKRYKH